MSFSSRVKSEMIKKNLSTADEKAAFLSGFIRATASIVEVNGKYGFSFAVESGETAEFVLFLLRSFGCDDYDVEVSARVNVDCVGERALGLLDRLEIIERRGDAYALNVGYGTLAASEAGRKAFIRGVFVGGGNVTVPVRREERRLAHTGYHLEFVFFGNAQAREFAALLERENFHTGLTPRKDNYIVYMKSAESIKDFLVAAGAPKAALELTDIMVEKEISASANRRTNCDLYNVSKQTEAAVRTIAAIANIDRIVGLENLPPQLRAAAEARRDHPEETLQELADRLSVGKSCLNHRLRKLTEMEKNLEENK